MRSIQETFKGYKSNKAPGIEICHFRRTRPTLTRVDPRIRSPVILDWLR